MNALQLREMMPSTTRRRKRWEEIEAGMVEAAKADKAYYDVWVYPPEAQRIVDWANERGCICETHFDNRNRIFNVRIKW